jgi:hypothetical protein
MPDNQVVTHNDNFEAFLADEMMDQIPILKFDGKEGRFKFGSDEETFELGTKLVLNPEECYEGFIQFHEGEPPSKKMSNMKTGSPIPRTSLGDDDPELWPQSQFSEGKEDPWIPTIEALFADPATGQNYKYSATRAKTQIRAFKALLSTYAKKRREVNGDYPEVEFQKEIRDITLKTGKISKTPIPVFTITDWVGCDEINFNAPVAKLTDQSNDDPPFNEGLPNDDLDDLIDDFPVQYPDDPQKKKKAKGEF